MDQKWKAFYCSTSVANFRDGLQRKFKTPEWHWLKHSFKPAVFFGLYNPVDYFRFLWHRGEKMVFWCGGDILNLKRRKVWQKVLNLARAKHVCENQVEYDALKEMGIESEIRPCLIDAIETNEIAFLRRFSTHVYLCAHNGREDEYGVSEIEAIAPRLPSVIFHIYGVDGRSKSPNVKYHGFVSPEVFNYDIRHYQAALRLNSFDGFSEILARSAILGQYPISRIQYPFMDHAPDTDTLVAMLRLLSAKSEPNYVARAYWIQELARPI